MERSHDGIVFLDEHLQARYANPAFTHLTGLSVADILGLPLEAWGAPETVLALLRPACQACVEGADDQNLTLQWPAHGQVPARAVSCQVALAGDGRTLTVVLSPEPAEEALRASEARLQAVLEVLSVGVYLADADGHIVSANRAGRAIWGEDLPMSQSPGEYGEDYPAWWAATGERITSEQWGLARALARGEVSHAEEIEIQSRDGTRKRILNYALPIRGEGEEIVGAVSVNVDISDRVRVEEALRASNERLREVLDNSQDVVEKYSVVTGRLEYVSPSILGNTGYSVDEFLAMTADQTRALIHPEDYPGYMQRTGELLASQEPAPHDRLEFRWRTNRGAWRWFSSTRTLIRDADGTPDSVVAILRDITTQFELEQALRASEERLREVLDGVPDVIAKNDARTGVFEYVSPAVRTTHGYTVEEFMALTVDEVRAMAHPEDRPTLLEQTRLLMADTAPRPSDLVEFRWRTKEGAWRWFSVARTLIRDADGAPASLVTTIRDISARKALEQTLQESEARLRVVLETLPVGVYIVEADGRVVTTNRTAQRIFGQTPLSPDPNAYGQDYPAWWPDGRRVESHEWGMARALATGEQVEAEEMEVRKTDGSRTTILNYALPIRNARGAITGGVAVNVDITERKAQERALHERMAALAALHEASRVLTEPTDSRSLLQSACDLVVGLFGLRMAWAGVLTENEQVLVPDAVAGDDQNYLGHVRIDLTDPNWQNVPVSRALRSGQPVVVNDVAVDPMILPEWRPRALASGLHSLAALPIRPGERVVGALVVYGDKVGRLDEDAVRTLQALANLVGVALDRAALLERVRQHAEKLEEQVAVRTAQLQASEERARAIFEQSTVGSALLDIQGRVLQSNPALQEMLGLDDQALRGRDLAALTWAPEDDEEDPFAGVLSGVEHVRAAERRFARPNGEAGWANVVVSTIRGEGETPQYLLGILEDVTETRAAMAALVQAEKLTVTGKLAATLTHEVNNPLQAVVGCLGLAREALAEGKDPQRFLTVAYDEVRRAARIVTRFRDLYQRSEDERPAPTALNELVDQVLTLSTRRAEEAGVVVDWRPGEGLPTLLLRRDALKQVFLNLVLNALEAMPQGGRLTVTTEASSELGGVLARVRDTGVGISPEDQAKVFESFYSGKDEGLGLGLYVCRSIVQQHGGNITLDSILGQGSTFSVWLPA
ncbi:MAG: PAS domain S-box protein [Anaerolineae bacterium]